MVALLLVRFACSAAVAPVPGRAKDMNIIVQVRQRILQT